MGSNIHGISCTANNYLKQAWNDIKNEYEKNQTYSITLFENTLVCFMRLYNELRRKVNEEDTPCLECESLEKEFEEMQNDNDLSSFLKTLHTKDTQIYSGVSGGFTYTIKYSQERELVIISLPDRSSETIADFKGYCWLNFIKFIEGLCDDVFSEYCLDDENISVQPEWINTPGISDLDTGIDLSDISFIQSEINKTYELKLTNSKYALKKDMFDKDALVFDNGQIEWAALALPDGKPYIALESKGFPNFGIWSKPGAPYVCLEPWCGRCDNRGFEGELSEKPGINALKAGEVFEKSYDIIVY